MTRLIHSLNDSLHIPAVGAEKLGAWLAGLSGRIVGTLRTWQTRARQRRELRELDDATLRDVGLTRAQANFSADKPFWRP